MVTPGSCPVPLRLSEQAGVPLEPEDSEKVDFSMQRAQKANFSNGFFVPKIFFFTRLKECLCNGLPGMMPSALASR